MAAETLIEYDLPLVGDDRNVYRARACGRERHDGDWEGWFEFESVDEKLVWRTSRETTQPNRTDLMYWATGISTVFLEGALRRAREPRPHAGARVARPPAFEGPADDVQVVAELAETTAVRDEPEPVLDPFVAYTRGEEFLRRRLGALDAWHLRSIARAHHVVGTAATLDQLAKPGLIELIVAHVRGRAAAAPGL